MCLVYIKLSNRLFLIIWLIGSLESGMKIHTIKKKLPNNTDQNGHTGEILCLALSSDFKFLVISKGTI